MYLCPKIFFILANSADPEMMQHFIWVFTVWKYLLTGIQNVKG